MALINARDNALTPLPTLLTSTYICIRTPMSLYFLGDLMTMEENKIVIIVFVKFITYVSQVTKSIHSRSNGNVRDFSLFKRFIIRSFHTL